jgi:hypothetical protein
MAYIQLVGELVGVINPGALGQQRHCVAVILRGEASTGVAQTIDSSGLVLEKF